MSNELTSVVYFIPQFISNKTRTSIIVIVFLTTLTRFHNDVV